MNAKKIKLNNEKMHNYNDDEQRKYEKSCEKNSEIELNTGLEMDCESHDMPDQIFENFLNYSQDSLKNNISRIFDKSSINNNLSKKIKNELISKKVFATNNSLKKNNIFSGPPNKKLLENNNNFQNLIKDESKDYFNNMPNNSSLQKTDSNINEHMYRDYLDSHNIFDGENEDFELGKFEKSKILEKETEFLKRNVYLAPQQSATINAMDIYDYELKNRNKPEYKQTNFDERWLTEPIFKDWVKPVEKNQLKVYCQYCSLKMTASAFQLITHMKATRHQTRHTNNNNMTCTKRTDRINTSDKISLVSDADINSENTKPQKGENSIISKEKNYLDSNFDNTLERHKDNFVHKNKKIKYTLEENFENRENHEDKKTSKQSRNISHENLAKICDNEVSSLSTMIFEEELDNDDINDLGPDADTDYEPRLVKPVKLKSKNDTMLEFSWSQYKKSYKKEWELNPMFKDWIASVYHDQSKAACKLCGCIIRANYSDLRLHCSSQKHRINLYWWQREYSSPSVLMQDQLKNKLKKYKKKEKPYIGKKDISKASLSLKSKTKEDIYKVQWESETSFQGWLCKVDGEDNKARCRYCFITMYARESDLRSHSISAIHAKMVSLGLKSQRQLPYILQNSQSFKGRGKFRQNNKEIIQKNSLDPRTEDKTFEENFLLEDKSKEELDDFHLVNDQFKNENISKKENLHKKYILKEGNEKTLENCLSSDQNEEDKKGWAILKRNRVDRRYSSKLNSLIQRDHTKLCLDLDKPDETLAPISILTRMQFLNPSQKLFENEVNPPLNIIADEAVNQQEEVVETINENTIASKLHEISKFNSLTENMFSNFAKQVDLWDFMLMKLYSVKTKAENTDCIQLILSEFDQFRIQVRDYVKDQLKPISEEFLKSNRKRNDSLLIQNKELANLLNVEPGLHKIKVTKYSLPPGPKFTIPFDSNNKNQESYLALLNKINFKQAFSTTLMKYSDLENSLNNNQKNYKQSNNLYFKSNDRILINNNLTSSYEMNSYSTESILNTNKKIDKINNIANASKPISHKKFPIKSKINTSPSSFSNLSKNNLIKNIPDKIKVDNAYNNLPNKINFEKSLSVSNQMINNNIVSNLCDSDNILLENQNYKLENNTDENFIMLKDTNGNLFQLAIDSTNMEMVDSIRHGSSIVYSNDGVDFTLSLA